MEENKKLDGVIPMGTVDAAGDKLDIELVCDSDGKMLYGSVNSDAYRQIMSNGSMNTRRLEDEIASLRAYIKILQDNVAHLSIELRRHHKLRQDLLKVAPNPGSHTEIERILTDFLNPQPNVATHTKQ